MRQRLWKYLQKTFFRSRIDADDLQGALQDAAALMGANDYASAIYILENLIRKHATNIEASNRLAVCYKAVGRDAEADMLEERAFLLDDTDGFLLYRQVNRLLDQQKAEEATGVIRLARASDPNLLITDYCAGRLNFATGRHELSPAQYLSSWLGNFDDLRLANARLWGLSYVEESEEYLSAEHHFWAATLKPAPINSAINLRNSSKSPVCVPHSADPEDSRIRIGYWSSDFREHSVRYFFRPLLEGHNASRFEVICYHDIRSNDAQTTMIRSSAERFYDVSDLADGELLQFIKGHQLDVLVELSGHTSNNRLPLLRQRLARVQISGLGYPPTTGLKSIDYKLHDPYTFVDGDELLYSEQVLRLRESFWCFDPMENVEAPDLAVMHPGDQRPLVFACFGNAAKITGRILKCWVEILNRVPSSRLQLRSHHFADVFSLGCWRARLESAGLPLDRVELFGPVSAQELFRAYNAVDVVLDTYPFNGGTTTCFATYMGVPVVSLFGRGLRSRMGLSVLSNLGIGHLAVADDAQYIAAAVDLDRDRAFLQEFRASARDRFKRSALGNGGIFARDLEAACEEILQRSSVAEAEYTHLHEVATLPPDELVRRAYVASSCGNEAAARRIIDHCLECYPQSPNALIYKDQELAQQSPAEAISQLLLRLPRLNGGHRISAGINLVRLLILEGRRQEALDVVGQLEKLTFEDELDKSQIFLFKAGLTSANRRPPPAKAFVPTKLARIIVPCDDTHRAAYLKERLVETLGREAGWRLEMEFCDVERRRQCYEEAGRQSHIDLVVIMQPHIELLNSGALQTMYAALEQCDLVGCYGARRWSTTDWRGDRFDLKAGSLILPTTVRNMPFELRWFGPWGKLLVTDIAVLDSSLIATRPANLARQAFDTELQVSGGLMEEYWTHQAHRAGLRLGVVHQLGVFISAAPLETRSSMAYGRALLIDRLALDPLACATYDYAAACLPANGIEECLGAALGTGLH